MAQAVQTESFQGQHAPEQRSFDLGDPVEDSSGALCFGGFRVHPCARSLTLHQQVVPLGSRAFDLLVVLLRSRGQLVTKEEIVREVWPATFVDESNLRFQMGVLRKALGPERDRIKTIPGRGYLFAVNDADAIPKVAPSLRAGVHDPSYESVIIIVEPDDGDRHAMASLLRALKARVISFTSVEEVVTYAASPLRVTHGSAMAMLDPALTA
ncbi:winged helix-turn-helix domain-containing protein [Sphingomonas glacialis]|nr:winged helix-turn-helix domain-containing protein [Sphingomonas glacialis]